MDVIGRIDELMAARGWTDYRLSQESGISPSTLANIRRRHSLPSIPTLNIICQTFGISLSQFFSEETCTVQLSTEQADFLSMWNKLTPKQKTLVMELTSELNS